jgi:hypothetical protein
MAEKEIFVNGVSGVSGKYLIEPMDFAEAAAMVKGELPDKTVVRFLRRALSIISQPFLGLPMDLDPTEIAQAGWAVVFHKDESQAVKDALAPLIERREAQAGKDTCKVLEFRTTDSWSSWLPRHGVSSGSVIPSRIPYYVLLVGDPERIPYSFEYLLNVEYAVGRVCFDTADEYRQYAESLIEYETSAAVPCGKSAVFFGTRHEFDRATQLSADLLVKPLTDGIPATREEGVAVKRGFATHKFWGPDATKANLGAIFQADSWPKPPAFLFSASHGMGWPRGHADQVSKQGALLCQDWPGYGSINAKHFFTGAELPADAKVHGMITFHFACYGAGTPKQDSFVHQPGKKPPQIADGAFVAELPKRLLTHPNGGALAAIGHVERAWGYSIPAGLGDPRLLPFQNAIGSILIGNPVGYSLKDFSTRYAALSTSLASLLEGVGFGDPIPDTQLVQVWIERNDAQNYVVIGDPATRLRVEAMS